MEVGNGGVGVTEYQLHMSLWALLAAPMLAGNDLTAMAPQTLAILTNKEVIAVDQDLAGIQGDRVWAKGAVEIWIKPLRDGSKAIGFFNRFEKGSDANIAVALTELGLPVRARARDLWQGKELGTLNETVAVKVSAHGVVLLRVWVAPRE